MKAARFFAMHMNNMKTCTASCQSPNMFMPIELAEMWRCDMHGELRLALSIDFKLHIADLQVPE